MSEKSEIRDGNGALIGERTTEDYNGGTREITQDASVSWGGKSVGSISSDVDKYPDGSVYHHKGSRIK